MIECLKQDKFGGYKMKCNPIECRKNCDLTWPQCYDCMDKYYRPTTKPSLIKKIIKLIRKA